MEITSVASVSVPPPLAGGYRSTSSGVATDIPVYKAVASVPDDVPQARPDNAARADTWSERRVVIDPGTQELVAQTIDSMTQEVVVQTPDRAQLGRRAYIDDVTRRQEDSARQSNPDNNRLPALMI